MLTVGCTGHRPTSIGGYKIPNPTYSYIEEETRRIIADLKPDLAISGMALGYDQLFAEICIDLGIPFIAAVPFVGQEAIWPKGSQGRYNNLLTKASEIVVVSEGQYAVWKLQIRNEYIVNRCDKLIAAWNGSPGGTANCVSYANKVGREVVRIDPKKEKDRKNPVL